MRLGASCVFSPDDSLVCLVHGVDRDKDAATLTMFDAATGQVLWERRAYGTTMFARNTGMLLQQEDFTKSPRFLDARTGEVKATMPLDFLTGYCVPELTSDGRHFVIGGRQQRTGEPCFWEAWLENRWPELFGNGLPGALVMESATGRELYRTVNSGDYSYALSHDASTLITVDRWDKGSSTMAIRVWNVRPTTAWLWALGLALGTGCALRLGALRTVRYFSSRKGEPATAVAPISGESPANV
jgi:hypothetical protein